jgi:hypothetical protein
MDADVFLATTSAGGCVKEFEAEIRVLCAFQDHIGQLTDSFQGILELFHAFRESLGDFLEQLARSPSDDYTEEDVAAAVAARFLSHPHVAELRNLFSSFRPQLNDGSLYSRFLCEFRASWFKSVRMEVELVKCETELRAKFDLGEIERQIPSPETISRDPGFLAQVERLSAVTKNLSDYSQICCSSIRTLEALLRDFECAGLDLLKVKREGLKAEIELLGQLSHPPGEPLPLIGYQKLVDVIIENLESIHDLRVQNTLFAGFQHGRFQDRLAVLSGGRFLDERLKRWREVIKSKELELERYRREIAFVRKNTQNSCRIMEAEQTRVSGDKCPTCAVDRQIVFGTCGHSFCLVCYESVMASRFLVCPFCSMPFTSKDIIRIQWTFID